MKRLVLVVLAAALAWSGYWLYEARSVGQAFEGWFDDRRAEGWAADVGDISVGGFPNRIDTTLTDLLLVDPDTGIAWSAPFLQVLRLSYRRGHVIVIWPPEQSVQIIGPPERRAVIESDTMRASLVLVPGDDKALERSNLDIAGLRVLTDAGDGWSADTLRLAVARNPGSPASYDVALAAGGVAPPEPDEGLRLTDLPRTLSLLEVEATLRFDVPLDRRAVEARRPQPVEIDLDRAAARWGEMDLLLAGKVTLDAEGTPEGELTLRAANWRDMLAVGEAAGWLPTALARTLESGLDLVAGLSGRRDTLDLPFRFSGGRMALGPIPLGPAPKLRLGG